MRKCHTTVFKTQIVAWALGERVRRIERDAVALPLAVQVGLLGLSRASLFDRFPSSDHQGAR